MKDCNLKRKVSAGSRAIAHRFSLIALCLMLAFTAAAQTKTVSGTVFDPDGEPIIGASVTVVGTSTGVATDIDGNFTIPNVADNAKIRISYIGYKPTELSVAGQNKFEVKLQEDSNVLDEVVAIGYATVKRSDLTGAASSVGAKELVNVPATTAAQALQGKAAGVNITTAGGAPGAASQITVRGGMSITQSSAPLYIVDGFEMSDALSNISVNDIETIDVLKDASATAIYGARGSNGIILITTKSAQKGKTKVDYNAFVSFDHMSKKMKMLDNAVDYATYQYDYGMFTGNSSNYARIFDNDMGFDDPAFNSGAYSRIAERYAGRRVIDWQDEVFSGSAFTQSHNVSIATGTEKSQILVSYNFNGQDGAIKNHDYKNNSIRTRINTELWKGIRFDMNALYTNTDTHGGGSYSGMTSVLQSPIMGGTYFTEDELLNTQTRLILNGLNTNYGATNQLIENAAVVTRKVQNLYSVNGGIEIDLPYGLVWHTAGSYKYSDAKSTKFADENSYNYLVGNASGMEGDIEYKQTTNWQITNTLRWSHTFNKVHRLDLLAGQEVTHSESEGMKVELAQFPNPNFGLDDISNTTVTSKKTSHSHSGIVSVFGRANYNYDDRYLLTATIRTDGSSKFARGHRWGVFPSAAAAWRISQEQFFLASPLASVFDNLKLRVGYGVTGNCNIDSYLYTTAITQTTYPFDSDDKNMAYVPSTRLGNPDLKWETLHATNIGLDMSLINGRVNFTVDWYNNQVNDLLMECEIPSSTGYKTQYQNMGKMRNRGWEFALNTVNIVNRDFQWTSALNLSFNRNKVISLENGVENKTFTAGSGVNGNVRYYASVGQPLGDMWGYKYKGLYTTADFQQDSDGNFITDASGNLLLNEGVVYQRKSTGEIINVKPGDIKFAGSSVDEDGNEYFQIGQYQKIGNGAPKFYGGFTNSFTYKGFDLNVFLKFSVGQDIYNASKQAISPYSQFSNVTKEFGLNYYRTIDPATGLVTMDAHKLRELNPDENSRVWNVSGNNADRITYPSSYFVEDGSYLRLATVTLGYTLPERLTKKAHISRLRVYFTGNNLAVWTNYSGYDPEVNSADNTTPAVKPGYDSNPYPRNRSYVIGVNLSF
ncbi:MAG: TonB-dependent receptor [Lachnospiraceae bacterium]|nr:TonB-dependent receptor [Lachnospiraceae bacterium]